MFAKLLVLLVAAAFLVGVVAHTSHGAGPERVYVVKPSDTLWTIAAHHYSGDPRAAVWDIEHRNGLRTETLRPGQRLVLP